VTFLNFSTGYASGMPIKKVSKLPSEKSFKTGIEQA
jgi:hypothetical protein